MGMTPVQYFESFVDGNAEDCGENPGCVRRAFNAAISASHLADHFFIFNKRHNPDLVVTYGEIGDYIEFLNQQTQGAFKDIRSIANAYKHLYTDSNTGQSVHSNVNSSGAIEAIKIDDSEELVRIEESFEEDDEGAHRSAVFFTRKNGSKSEFLPILNSVVEFWRDNIY